MKWISVLDQLPPKWDDVLVYPRPTDYCCEAHYTGAGWLYGEYEPYNGQVNRPTKVTHWMQFPKDPDA